MAAAKSRNTRLCSAPGGASKRLRYIHIRSHSDGSQSRQDSGTTVCGSVTSANPLSSNSGWLLPADAGPNRHPVPNGCEVIRLRGEPPASAPSRAGPRR
jgi:hypothetical protein